MHRTEPPLIVSLSKMCGLFTAIAAIILFTLLIILKAELLLLGCFLFFISSVFINTSLLIALVIQLIINEFFRKEVLISIYSILINIPIYFILFLIGNYFKLWKRNLITSYSLPLLEGYYSTWYFGQKDWHLTYSSTVYSSWVLPSSTARLLEQRSL